MCFSPYWITTQKTWPVNWVWKVWKIPETAACVYPAISPETLTRSSANESATGLKTGEKRTWCRGGVGGGWVRLLWSLTNLIATMKFSYLILAKTPPPHGPLTFQGGLNFARCWWELSSPGCRLNCLNGHPANCAEPRKKETVEGTEHYSHLSGTKSFFSVIPGTFKWHVLCTQKALNMRVWVCVCEWTLTHDFKLSRL